MAGLREIQNRIRSIQDTRKITSAMYLISSTKLKKARKELADTEPYFYALQNILRRIQRHLPNMESPYFEKEGHRSKKTGLLVISGDKGLAGAYNHNIMKLADTFLSDSSREVHLFVVGETGRQFFASQHIPIEENFQYTAQDPTFNRARWIAGTLLEQYLSGNLDEVHVLYTRMENVMQSVAKDKRVLPLMRPDMHGIPMDVMQEEFSLRPSPEEALDAIVPNYVAGFIYGALVESFCSEQNARMMAMDSATDNADALLKDLNTMYNRARQAAITQEITEVCGGAAAQRREREEEMRV